MSPKEWSPTPTVDRSVEGFPSTVFSVVLISSRWTQSTCLFAKFIGLSPTYTPVVSQVPPRPSSRPRSSSRPSDSRISIPGETVRVIKPFTLFTSSVWFGVALASFSSFLSLSNQYRPGSISRVSSATPALLHENVSPCSMLYHPTAKVIDLRPIYRRPSQLSIHRCRRVASPL